MVLRRRRADRDGKFGANRAQRAIIDIGSNTVRLVVYGGSPRAPIVLLNEKVIARLGHEIGETGRLADDAIDIAMRGLERYALILKELAISDVEVVATAAARDAENGPEFLEQVRQLGLSPRLLSGKDEARISAMGVIGAFPGAAGVVADLGGGSLELVRIENGGCGVGTTLPLGTLRLPELRITKPGEVKKSANQMLKAAGWDAAVGGNLYLVGGTWRAMAVYAMQQQSHSLSDPHGLEVGREEIQAISAEIAAATPDELRAIPRISSQRSQTMPDAAALLLALLKRLDPDKVVFSSWGLREGLLFDRLEDFARQQDPLLAGMAVFAGLHGCPPTLAARVAAWTVGAIPASRPGLERLRLAATMLALASMQTEPNIRTEQAVEWALQKRWIGLAAHERAMLAAAISANGNHTDLDPRISELASPEAIDDAVCWGLSIRLCRRLGGLSRATFESTRLAIEDGKLVLKLEESHAPLFGVPNEKDLRLLGDQLGLEYLAEIVPDFSVAATPVPDPVPGMAAL